MKAKKQSKPKQPPAKKSRVRLKDTGLAIGFKGSDVPPIAITHRGKSAFWNTKKNVGSPADPDVTYGSVRTVVWTCPTNSSHEWVMTVVEFCSRKVNCLFCATPPAEVGKSLAEKFPELAAQWDKRLNEHKTPDSTKWTATYKAHWICDKNKNHCWRASVRSRTHNGEGCPFCYPCTNSKDTLSNRFPEISAIWDYNSNQGITPDSIKYDSGVSVYWTCERRHRTMMAIDDRVKYGANCRSCSPRGRTFLSLFEKFPEIAAEWDQKKNGNLKPDEVPAGSGMLAYWKCSSGHSWQINIAARTVNGSDCPYCMGHLVSEDNSLAAVYPEIASQWHKKKNGNRKPSDFFPGSVDRMWWKCPISSDHEWNARIVDRTSRESGCPFCVGLKSALSNSLGKNFPEIARQLHPTRNGNIDPNQLYMSSGKSLWWQCPLIPEHVWKTMVRTRTKQGTGCPLCVAYRTDYNESLAKLYPKVAKEWHPTANPIGPELFKPFSQKKVWWRCKKNPKHEWQAVIANRTLNQTSCPFCINQRIDDTNCMATTMPALAREFHPTKNGTLTPYNISAQSSKNVVWQCLTNAAHEWTTKPNMRVLNNSGCPYCSHRLIDESNSLSALYPVIAGEWHEQKNGNLKAKNASSTSPKVVWWRCTKDKKHEWEQSIASRTRSRLPCPFCSGRKATKENSLASTHPALAREWHETKNGSFTPKDFMANSTKSVWWRCKKGPDHVWSAPVARRAVLGNRCPFCMSKKASVTNSLASLYPEIASEFHPTRNGKLKATDVLPQSNKLLWWRCKKNSKHVWEALPYVRVRGTGCPHCRKSQ